MLLGPVRADMRLELVRKLYVKVSLPLVTELNLPYWSTNAVQKCPINAFYSVQKSPYIRVSIVKELSALQDVTIEI